jgi:hypothetical protein
MGLVDKGQRRPQIAMKVSPDSHRSVHGCRVKSPNDRASRGRRSLLLSSHEPVEAIRTRSSS